MKPCEMSTKDLLIFRQFKAFMSICSYCLESLRRLYHLWKYCNSEYLVLPAYSMKNYIKQYYYLG